MSNQKNGSKHVAPRKKKTNFGFKNFFNRIVTGFKALSKGKKALVISLVSLIVVLAVLIGIVLGIIGDLTKDYNHQEIDDPEFEEVEQIDNKIINVALFGIDSRSKNFKGLSDSIMVLSINKNTGDIKLISIMRDSLVKMPELKGKTYKPNKINSAYSKGGPSYAIKVLNQNFGLDINEYATVNFFGMAEIVDAVGGIEIEVTSKELNTLNVNIGEQAHHAGIKNPTYVKKAGKQLLNGLQAVGWARIRTVSTADGEANDYGRTDRQRIVMEMLLNKALSMSVGEYPALIKAVLPHVETSISFGEALALATDVLGKKVNFQQTRVPQQEYVIPDNYCSSYAGSAVYYDINYAAKVIHAIIYDGISQEDYIAQNGVEKNKWYRSIVVGGGSSSGSSKPADNTSTSSEGSSSESSSSGSSSSGSSGSSSSGSSSGGSSSGGSSDDDSSADNSGSSGSGESSSGASSGTGSNDDDSDNNNDNNNNDNNNDNNGGDENTNGDDNNAPEQETPPANQTPPANEGNE